MEKYYKDEKILKKIASRLVPPDNTYQDCVCKVIMTENFLYILEDNFDGSFNCLFEIPLKKILSVEKYISEDGREASGDDGFISIRQLASAFVAVLCGHIWLPGKERQNEVRSYLHVIYRNEDDVKCHIYFENCSSIRGMVNIFKKYKI